MLIGRTKNQVGLSKNNDWNKCEIKSVKLMWTDLIYFHHIMNENYIFVLKGSGLKYSTNEKYKTPFYLYISANLS